jgi:Asp-tRNA(Asn)/Glu-tRNA(Gln) amidotransferase A subunit family amidase
MLCVSPLVMLACAPADGPAPSGFVLEETTIADIHAAMEAGELTARALVEMYLDRIEAYDKKGPALNAIIRVNPRALERADELDAAFAASGFTGPLHGIPVIVKDNYDTHDMPTSAGSASLADSIPPDDAFQVRRIREAGAIVLAKSNMAEFAFSPYETIGSAIPGYTRNPYSTNRVPAGSSGGTGAAVAANLGAVGLGTDTGNSIRGPSSHNSLVGIRSTMGLTSRDGIVPLYFNRDIGGPMARTVADAVLVFDVIAGHDPADPVTAAAQEHEADNYSEFLDPAGLSGRRLGVVRYHANVDNTHPDVLRRFDEALADLRAGGAEIVDPVHIELLANRPEGGFWCARFRHDLENYLASLGPEAPARTLEEIFESREFHHSVRQRLQRSMDEISPDESEACALAAENSARLATEVADVMDSEDLDALVYPSWSHPPRLIGDLASPAGDNSQILSPQTGFPAITVPMGFVTLADRELPVGLQILGVAWSEPTLIEIAYAYEQATRHRVPPSTTPPLRR